MNIGQNFLEWFQSNAQPITIVGIIVMGLFFGFTRKVTALIVTLIVGVIAVLFVFNPLGVKDFFLEFGNKLIGA